MTSGGSGLDEIGARQNEDDPFPVVQCEFGRCREFARGLAAQRLGALDEFLEAREFPLPL